MTPTTPPLSPFVRGTTDTSHIYYLLDTTRRLIPDAQTLAYMLAGETVRVLTDADLAAIPLGARLPSRKDGQVVTEKLATLPPFPIAYYTMGGMRRLIPDPETLTALKNSGLALTQIVAADLNAIPLGSPFPSRKDGSIYLGTAPVFAYVMQGGKKRAVPNATTLRDLGLQATAIAISSADLALIPNGAAYPSTSKFLSPPSTKAPLVLLPVRLETRIDKPSGQLWLRVYPDDVHINSFEPALTADEQAARTAFLALSTTDLTNRQAAFAALARQPNLAALMANPGFAAAINQSGALAASSN